jgi:glutamate/tyrosine decarboxylase-like PLP-dependent enzyme
VKYGQPGVAPTGMAGRQAKSNEGDAAGALRGDLFLGSDGALDETFRRLLDGALDDHLSWRHAFGAAGAGGRRPALAGADLERALGELKAHLRGSAPFHSPYYIAHMASDVLVPGLVGYIAGLLYNQNNIASEKSPSTTPLELEVAGELAAMIGYDPRRAWGHLTSGGTVANFEGLWAARNLKAFPFAALELAARKGVAFRVKLPEGGTEDIRKLSPVELLNLPVPEVMRMRGRLEERVGRHAVSETLAAFGPAGEGLASLGDRGVTSIGRILLPGTKHYSWLKVAEALGVGRASLRFVDLDSKMRMKPSALEARIRECRDLGEAVLAVVAVVGSTAEGAVDPVDDIARVQARQSRRGSPFYLHADAAYGGYARSALIGAKGGRARVDGASPFAPAVARALQALPLCDSVTVDPHKFGYIPVPAGSIVFRDEGIRGVLATPRPYFARGVEDWRETPPSSIGGFILEGTKPGAAAAACWLAHAVLPLNRGGIGRLIARATDGAAELRNAVRAVDGMTAPGRGKVRAKLLTPGDLSILCFALNPASNRSLAKANQFNKRVHRAFAIEEQNGEPRRFVLSSTVLRREEYGDAPVKFLESLGIARREWERVKAAFLLRAVVLSPEIAGSGQGGRFREALAAAVAA